MKISKFIKSTLILLVGGFLTKVLGMLGERMCGRRNAYKNNNY